MKHVCTNSRGLLLLAILFSICHIMAFSQQGGGIISGQVQDQTSAPIYDAEITLINTSTQQKIVLKTNPNGNFSSPSIPLGIYTVVVKRDGFRGEQREGVTVEVDSRLKVDFSLTIGSVNETVDVSTENAQVNVESTELGTVFSRRPIQDLPVNGRSVLALAQLSPGVTSNAGPTNKGFADRGSLVASISINNGANASNAVQID